MKRIIGIALGLLISSAAIAQPVTTREYLTNGLTECAAANTPIVGNGANAQAKCHASGALGSAAFVNTGTSGATIGLLNAANTWSALQTFNSAMLAATAPVFTGTITGTYTLGGTPSFPLSGLTGLGTGVATALGVATNGAGGFPTYTAGTWTPTLSTTGTVGTPAYSIQVGSYEQIGRQVTVRFTITLSGWTGSPTGNVTLAGLPLTSANVANDTGVCHMSNYVVTGLAASNFNVSAYITPNATFATLLQASSTGTSSITAAQVGTTPTFIGVCNYHT